MKILIVDDSAVMRKIVMKAVRQAGFGGHKFIEAASGKEGLEQLDKESPELVLCDWNMPEMTGIEMLDVLRGAGNEIPFCFVTSEATAPMRKQATDSGANGFLTKPFTSDDLERALGAFLS
ncbi:MAG: response regulator [Myxococcota bacterium]